MAFDKLVFRVHAIRRMFERRIAPDVVREVLTQGEVIEEYPNDEPFPSRLVLGWRRSKPIHVVAADDRVNQETIVITVYEPNPMKWDSSFKRRKKK